MSGVIVVVCVVIVVCGVAIHEGGMNRSERTREEQLGRIFNTHSISFTIFFRIGKETYIF